MLFCFADHSHVSCRREFEHAVQCGKFMIPVLIPAFEEDEDDIPGEREGETGWMGPVTAGDILLHCIT